MTRAGQLRWFDGSKFTTKQGKELIKALFKVGSTKDLKKSQVDFLYNQFGEVLAGRACLAQDEKGVPFIQYEGVAAPPAKDEKKTEKKEEKKEEAAPAPSA